MSRASWPIAIGRDHVVHARRAPRRCSRSRRPRPSRRCRCRSRPAPAGCCWSSSCAGLRPCGSPPKVYGTLTECVSIRAIFMLDPPLALDVGQQLLGMRLVGQPLGGETRIAGAAPAASRCGRQAGRRRRRLGLAPPASRPRPARSRSRPSSVLKKSTSQWKGPSRPGIAQPSAGSRGAASTAARNRPALISVSISTIWPSTGRL